VRSRLPPLVARFAVFASAVSRLRHRVEITQLFFCASSLVQSEAQSISRKVRRGIPRADGRSRKIAGGNRDHGETREEALTYIHSVLFMILQQILAQGAAVPGDVEVPKGALISVKV
jgi:hypothetical protein